MNIDFIKKTLKPPETNRFLNILLTVFYIIISPLILLFGLLFMLFIFGVKIIQNITMSKHEKKLFEQEQAEQSKESDHWSEFTGYNSLKIYQKYVGEIRFGPAYLNLKSEPKITEIENKLFGYWFYQFFDGIFLQEWHSTESPNCDLIFIDINNKEVLALLTSINSVFWEMKKVDQNSLLFIYETGKEKKEYLISQDKLKDNNNMQIGENKK